MVHTMGIFGLLARMSKRRSEQMDLNSDIIKSVVMAKGAEVRQTLAAGTPILCRSNSSRVPEFVVIGFHPAAPAVGDNLVVSFNQQLMGGALLASDGFACSVTNSPFLFYLFVGSSIYAGSNVASTIVSRALSVITVTKELKNVI